METASFGETSLSCQYDETSYNGPSEAKDWFFIQFLHQSPFFQVPLDRFFFQINASYFCNFPWPSTSAWTFLNAGSIYVSYLIRKISICQNPRSTAHKLHSWSGNDGRLNWIFLYVLDWSLQVISRQLQVFHHLSSYFNLSWITNLIMI